MTHHLRILALALAALSAPCIQAATENAGNAPYDFSYRVTGSPEIRPTLVFNDGKDTYLELDQDVRVSVAGGATVLRQGPYYVVRGVSPLITLSARAEKAIIHHEPTVVQPIVQAEELPDPPRSLAATPAPAPETAVKAPAPASQPGSSTVAAPSCTPKATQSETSILVAFAPKSAGLSTAAVEQLREHARQNDQSLAAVRVRTPFSTPKAIAKRRQQFITDHLAKSGVPRALVEHESADTIQGLTELVFVKKVERSCNADRPVVTLREGALTILAHEVDAAALLEQVAGQMSLPLRTEGEARELPVSVAVVAQPPAVALGRVGGVLGSSADIVLRDTEIVLKFN